MFSVPPRTYKQSLLSYIFMLLGFWTYEIWIDEDGKSLGEPYRQLYWSPRIWMRFFYHPIAHSNCFDDWWYKAQGFEINLFAWRRGPLKLTNWSKSNKLSKPTKPWDNTQLPPPRDIPPAPGG